MNTANVGVLKVTNRDLQYCLQVPDNVNARQLADTCSDTLEWLMKSGDQVHENELTSRLSMLMREAEPDKYGRLWLIQCPARSLSSDVYCQGVAPLKSVFTICWINYMMLSLYCWVYSSSKNVGSYKRKVATMRVIAEISSPDILVIIWDQLPGNWICCVQSLQTWERGIASFFV